MWPLLLQCKIHGKAQEVVSSLPLADSLQYDSVKEAILHAYELVPEAYRPRFRGYRKTPSQTYVELPKKRVHCLIVSYCHKRGHVIANCLLLKKKDHSNSASPERQYSVLSV